MDRINLTPEQLKDLVTREVNRLISDKEDFTAWDVTWNLRDDLPQFEIPHGDTMRDLVMAAYLNSTGALNYTIEWRDYPQPDGSVVGARTFVHHEPVQPSKAPGTWLRIIVNG